MNAKSGFSRNDSQANQISTISERQQTFGKLYLDQSKGEHQKPKAPEEDASKMKSNTEIFQDLLVRTCHVQLEI